MRDDVDLKYISATPELLKLKETKKPNTVLAR